MEEKQKAPTGLVSGKQYLELFCDNDEVLARDLFSTGHVYHCRCLDETCGHHGIFITPIEQKEGRNSNNCPICGLGTYQIIRYEQLNKRETHNHPLTFITGRGKLF